MNEHEIQEAMEVVHRCARFVRAWLDRWKMLERPRFFWGNPTPPGPVDERAIAAVAMNVSGRLLLADVARYEPGIELFEARIAIEFAEDTRALARLRLAN